MIGNMVDKTWRNRGGTSGIADVLDRGRNRRLFSQQRMWRQLVGRTLGELTASLGVNEEGSLRVMAGNVAAQKELLARDSHVLAAWNALAGRRGTPQAERLVCWVNAKVGRNAQRARPVIAEQNPSKATSSKPQPDPKRVAELSPPEVQDAELRAVLGRIAAKIRAASSEGSDPA